MLFGTGPSGVSEVRGVLPEQGSALSVFSGAKPQRAARSVGEQDETHKRGSDGLEVEISGGHVGQNTQAGGCWAEDQHAGRISECCTKITGGDEDSSAVGASCHHPPHHPLPSDSHWRR